jgi:hypothetical protein
MDNHQLTVLRESFETCSHRFLPDITPRDDPSQFGQRIRREKRPAVRKLTFCCSDDIGTYHAGILKNPEAVHNNRVITQRQIDLI